MATKQKIVSFKTGEEFDVNFKYLDKGWVVKQMIPEYVGIASGSITTSIRGNIIVLLEKED